MSDGVREMLVFADRLDRKVRAGGQVVLVLDQASARTLARSMRGFALSKSYYDQRGREIEAEMDALAERAWVRDARLELAARRRERLVRVWECYAWAAVMALAAAVFLAGVFS